MDPQEEEVMTFLHTLLEEGKNPFKGNRLELDKAAQFVAKECRQSLNAAPIYTSGDGRFDAFLVHPSTRKPVSVLEILIDDVLESWSTYPNRTKSLIGSGQPSTFRVFPVDGANVAYTQKPTFADAFQHIQHQFGNVDIEMRNLMQIIANTYNMKMGNRKPVEVPENLSGPKMKEFFKMSDEIWASPKHRNVRRLLDQAGADESVRERLNALLELGERKIGTGIEHRFDPKSRDVNVTTIDKFPSGMGEAWTDAPAVLVRTDKLGEL